ncbi:MAG: flippase-like domain-containing protein [Marinilabiliaceae bacterium]|nr:flippase-like domain-containing protein [Marinilabiliaceae bacterium]
MKRKIVKIVQFILFLGIGVGVFLWIYKDQNLSDLFNIIQTRVNFWWIVLSLILGVLSHLSRSLRWQMLIESVEKKTKWYNVFMAVFVGYIANLVLPRAGEVARCGVLSKYEKISFTRLAGTVVTERLTDLVFLVLLVLLSFVIKFNLLVNFFSENIDFSQIQSVFTSFWLYLAIAVLVILFIIIRIIAIRLGMFSKIEGIWFKFIEGIASVKNIDSKGFYLFYSAFIWLMYFGMQYTCFFAMQETSNLNVSAGIVILVTGSIGMLAPVQGGIGAWHGMVIATLALYGVTQEPAYAFALLVHGAQNLLIIVLGLISLIVLPVVNGKSNSK